MELLVQGVSHVLWVIHLVLVILVADAAFLDMSALVKDVSRFSFQKSS